MTFVFFTDRDIGTAFPEILKRAGSAVERHRDHFAADCPDEDWLAEIGRRDWVAITHNLRIRYTPNELAAVIRHRVRLLVIVGKAPFPVLAASFVATRERIEAFLEDARPPIIAKVYQATPAQLAENPAAVGHIERWYPK